MKKTLASLFLLLGIMTLGFVSCAKKQTPDGNFSQENPNPNQSLERSINIIYPVNAENMRQMTETEIKDNYQTMVKSLFPEEKRAQFRAMKSEDLDKYIYNKITTDSQIISIMNKFRENGVVLNIGPEVSTNKSTRYGSGAHKALGRTSTGAVLNFLNATGEKDQFLAKLQTNEYDFIENVQKEDEYDYVFKLGKINGGIKLQLKLLVVTFTVEFQCDDVVTISHFWNPDMGWNAGLTEFFPRMRNKVVNMAQNNSTVQFFFLPNEIPSLVDLALAVASNFLDQEYLLAIVKNPPSSYYKALCYWYGWKNIKMKYIAPGGVYVGTIDAIEEFNPGVKDLLSSNPGLASMYLAHIMHLLQDATVPCHAHLDTHAPDADLGGSDIYENQVVNNFITSVIEKNSYRFQVQNSSVVNFTKYTLAKVDETLPLDQQGYFYQKVDSYYQMLNGTYGLWPLFFNAANAAQFFPTFKAGMNRSKLGNKNTPYGTYLFNGSDTVSTSNNDPYNDPSQYDMSYTPSDAAASKAYSEKGTYYLIYNGTAPITDADAKNAITIIGGNVVVNSDYTLMYLGNPFDRMADNLVPIAVAASARLARNYYRTN